MAGLPLIGRRALLAGMASALALAPGSSPGQTTPPAAPPVPTAPPATGADSAPAAVWLTLRGAGLADGSSWDNPAPFRDIGRLAAAEDAGPVFRLGLNGGDIPPVPLEWSGQQMLFNAAGTPEAPLHLQFGRIGPEGQFTQPTGYAEPPDLRMTGNETLPGERIELGGAPFLVLGPAAAHLWVSGPVFDRAGGRGFFNLSAEGAAEGATLRNLSFCNIHARRAGRVIECEEGTRLEGLLVERCSALGLVRGFARFFDLSGAEFRDLDLDADLMDGGGGAVCQIISIVRGSDLTFRNVRLAKAVNALGAEERGSPYIQGDGLVLEEETSDVVIENCHASDMGDGGFDLKSQRVTMRDCSATRCKLGIRIWSLAPENLIERCTVTEPVRRPENDGACLWIAGQLTARDCTLTAADGMSPIRFGSGPDKVAEGVLTMQGGAITHEDGVALATGSEGRIELQNVMVNGEDTSGRFHWTGRRLREGWL